MKALALIALLAATASTHAAGDAALIRPIEQAAAVRTIERAECSQHYAAAADGDKVVFWRAWGTHEAYMNVGGRLAKLTYLDPGEYPEDKRLPYRQTWVGEGVTVTVQVTQEAFCAPDDTACEGVELGGLISVEQDERKESIKVAGYSGC